MKRSEMTINILAQLVHSPDVATSTHIKNFIDLPRQYDKPTIIAKLLEALEDDTDIKQWWENE